ncbi:expressed unknown protein [Seminavis robusta]|uniref:Uncharacterized protein n=1 Tax=Seminavis robusta TaxID=568900 RepID=A0A9N8E0B1_9STRA|nr:expressed unknown protein [Seminavis robusta]|eukprot:Sro423_g139790.1 n/a (223) ;mRNA; f:29373-30107
MTIKTYFVLFVVSVAHWQCTAFCLLGTLRTKNGASSLRLSRRSDHEIDQSDNDTGSSGDGENNDPTINIVSGELEKGVPGKAVGGAALAASTLSAVKGGSLALSGAAGVSAALLAVSKGFAGETMRQREVRRVNSAVARKGAVVMDPRSAGDSRADDLLRELDEFKTEVFETYDELYQDIEALDSLEMDIRQSSGRYQKDLSSLKGQIKQELRETQLEQDSN